MRQFDEEPPLALALRGERPSCFDCSELGLEENYDYMMPAIPAPTPAIELPPGQVEVAVSHVNEQGTELSKLRDSLKEEVTEYEKQQEKDKSLLELHADQEDEKKKNDPEKQQGEDKPHELQEEQQQDEEVPPLRDAPQQEDEEAPPVRDASVVMAGEADVHEQPGSMAVNYAWYKGGNKNTMNQSKSNFWFYCFNGNVFAPRITGGAVVVAIIFFLMYGAYTGTSTETKTAFAETVVPRALIAVVKGDEWYKAPKICPNSELAVKTAKGSWHCATLKNSPTVHDEIEGQYLEMGAMWDLSHNFTHAIYRGLYKGWNTKLTNYQIGTMFGTALATAKFLPAQLLKMNKVTLGFTFCAWCAGAMYDVFANHGPNPKCGLKLKQK